MPNAVRSVAVAVGLVLLLVSITVVVTREDRRYAGYNDIRRSTPAIALQPRQELCQGPEVVPAGADAVEYAVQTAGVPGPALELRITAMEGDRRALARGRAAGGYGDGLVAIPVGLTRATRLDGRVCLRNRGTRPVTLLGQPTTGTGAVVDGRVQKALVRTAYLRPGAESWLALAPTVAHRFGLAKTRLAGSWTLWAVFGLMALSVALAVRVVLREGAPR